MQRLQVVLVVLMVLLSACVAPLPAPGQQAVSQPAASEPIINEQIGSEHEHALPPELGEVNFPVSCTPAAQAKFNDGLALLHSFQYPDAIQSFTTVTELDPSCAMAHWGVAMSLWEPLWPQPPIGQTLVDGWAAVEKATAAGAKTAREAAYIAAITAFYQDAATLDHRTRAIAYAQAMAELAQAYPEDTEAQIFYALALGATALPSDKSYANQRQAIAILEPIYVAQPNHPGVAHYLIHSNDYPALAAQGLDAAQRYAQIAPAAPHALHMPSHIFTRLGNWQESIDINRASAAAAKDRLTAAHGQGTGLYNDHVLHAMDYQMYAHLQLGQDAAAQQLLDEIDAIAGFEKETFAIAYALAAMPARYALERSQWAEAASLTLPTVTLAWENFAGAKAVLIFARGLGAARSGDVGAAGQELERLQALQAALVEAKNAYWAGQVEIQATAVAAWMALAEGRNEEALTQMRQAVALEDATEKHPVTPGPIKPAHELLGEMLLVLEQPAEALQEFEVSQRIEPNRFLGWYFAARAAAQAGELEKVRDYYEAVLKVGANADSERAELAEAAAFLAQ